MIDNILISYTWTYPPDATVSLPGAGAIVCPLKVKVKVKYIVSRRSPEDYSPGGASNGWSQPTKKKKNMSVFITPDKKLDVPIASTCKCPRASSW